DHATAASFTNGNSLADALFKIDDDIHSGLEDITDDHVTQSSEEVAALPSASSEAEEEGPTFTIKETEIEQSEIKGAPAASINNPTEAMPFDPRADLSRYVFPGLDLLADRPSGNLIDPEEQQKNKDLIVKTLLDYKIPIQKIEATIGPTVTLYEIVPAEGVRIAQIQRLENDIALSLAALGIRIIAPIPGAGTVGIEVPNRDPKTVSIRSIIGSKKFAEACEKMRLPMAMGATISNDIFIQDLAKMPHLLVAGATGQGKSVGLNCIIASLLYAKHPSELKFVFIDPKMVEFAAYKKIERHFLAKLPDEEEPIITDPMKVPGTLSSLCVEMDNRYLLMSKANVRSVEEYNRKFCNHALNPENGHKYMPYIVTIVDEFADLIMVGGKEVPMHIARIAQKGRAAGMHIIIATQRPSADVISGMIKNNFPGRIAFRVMSMVDSKTILDRPGANQLIGRGDMLFLTNGNIERVQCAFIDTPEIDDITDHISNQIGYESAYLLPEPVMEGAAPSETNDPSKRDALFNDCARFIVTQSTASTSSLQRRFSIGYNKAGKIMDQMEAAGIVGAAQGAKPRAVLMDAVTLESIL
ncbi:MAG: DNA translocase FtsK, partial [Muribaculaceae bacterium]|nr:DNA translocase FtsK [Muribaculaceae bacterium]